MCMCVNVSVHVHVMCVLNATSANVPAGLDKIEYLQNNSSEKIYQMAYRIIEHYFSTEEDTDSTVAPHTSDGGQFVFCNDPTSQPGEFRF